VNTVIIPRACDNYSPNAEGLIFVEFDSVHSARQAAAVLNGRKFADKTVVVAFVSDSSILALHSCRFLKFVSVRHLQYDEQEFASRRLI
jgi:hypothetical protein